MTPQQKWEALRQEIIARVDAIDNETPWAECEPDWWLDMMDVRDVARVVARQTAQT